jgi:hypothetical protein
MSALYDAMLAAAEEALDGEWFEQHGTSARNVATAIVRAIYEEMSPPPRPDPEPEWQPGDVVVAASGIHYIRGIRDWGDFDGSDVPHEKLTLLTRGGVPWPQDGAQ